MDQSFKIGDHDSGVRIEDLLDSREFLSRRQKETEPDREARAVERLKKCRFENPEAVLQELVQIAVDFCHADSAGISIEEANEKNELQFRWIAVAGSFARYLNGTTPRFYSPCGTCIDRGVPQHYQVTHPYYNFLGVKAEPILDGVLIPWRTVNLQGTFWLVSHSSTDAFDKSDYEFLHTVADFVSKEIRNHSPN
jgi:hypothetical protein